MNFDELWRLNLDRDRALVDSVDKTEVVGVLVVYFTAGPNHGSGGLLGST